LAKSRNFVSPRRKIFKNIQYFYKNSSSASSNTTKLDNWKGMIVSGVARVPCALKQGIIFCPLSTKTTEFEMKHRCKSCGRSKNETFTVVIL